MSAHIVYRRRELYCEDLPLSEIATAVGTPTYIYSQAALQSRALAFLNAAPDDALVCYAVKANSNPHLLRLLAEIGLGADVTSGGELFLALHSGFAPTRILFSGVGKTEPEIEQALAAGIRGLHVESEQEMQLLSAIAARRQQVVEMAVRVNPDIAANTHAHISTGGRQHKFGVAPEMTQRMLLAAKDDAWLRPAGVAVHIGSQITELAPYEQAAKRAIGVAQRAVQAGVAVTYVDMGGGLGVDYTSLPGPDPASWVHLLAKQVTASGFRLAIEPGRAIVAPAGLLLTRVLYLKEQHEHRFAVVDAGMNALLRPALYDAHHPILPVIEPRDANREIIDIVGPICETGDYLGRERALPQLQPGALLAVLQAGAYGFAMSSNYNGQMKPAEVLVSGSEWRLIRSREAYSTLLQGT